MEEYESEKFVERKSLHYELELQCFQVVWANENFTYLYIKRGV